MHVSSWGQYLKKLGGKFRKSRFFSVENEWRSCILAWLILEMIGIIVNLIFAVNFFVAAAASILSWDDQTRSDSDEVAIFGAIMLLSTGE